MFLSALKNLAHYESIKHVENSFTETGVNAPFVGAYF